MNNQTEIIRAIAEGIIQCAIFADKPEGTNPRVTKQAKQAAESIAAQFVGIIGDDLLSDAVEAYADGYCEVDKDAPECIGYDVWYTMRGHGVGFWDRDFLKVDKYGEAITLGQQLTDACRKLKHVEPTFYRGWMYLE